MSCLMLCDVSGFLSLNVLTLGLDHALLWEAALSIRAEHPWPPPTRSQGDHLSYDHENISLGAEFFLTENH